MKKKHWIITLLAVLAGLSALCSLVILFRQAKAEALLAGVRRIRRGEAQMVPLSHRVTRMLTRSDHRSEQLFRNYMKGRGWEYVCNYGRSALYRKGSEEVLVRRSVLIKDFCLYEVLDEDYFKYMKSEIREAA